MYRTIACGLALAMLANTGCLWNRNQTNKNDNNSTSSMFTRDAKPNLLVGPQGTNNAPQELPPAEAAVACLTAAHEMDKSNQVDEAIRLYEKARTENPNLAGTISRRLAVLYDKAGKFHLSREEYAIAMKATPTDVELLCDVGYSYYCQNDWTNAEKYLRQATQLQSQHKRSWVNLGLTLGARADFQGAYEAFMMAGTPGEAHCNLAFCMTRHSLNKDAAEDYRQTMKEAAKEEYRKAMAIEPGNALAQKGLALLENPQPIPQPKPETPKGNFKRADASSVPSILDIMERQRQEEASKRNDAKVSPTGGTER